MEVGFVLFLDFHLVCLDPDLFKQSCMVLRPIIKHGCFTIEVSDAIIRQGKVVAQLVNPLVLLLEKMVQLRVRLSQISLHLFDHIMQEILGVDNRLFSFIELSLERIYMVRISAYLESHILNSPFKVKHLSVNLLFMLHF